MATLIETGEALLVSGRDELLREDFFSEYGRLLGVAGEASSDRNQEAVQSAAEDIHKLFARNPESRAFLIHIQDPEFN